MAVGPQYTPTSSPHAAVQTSASTFATRLNALSNSTQVAWNGMQTWMDRAQARKQNAERWDIMKPVMESEARLQAAREIDALALAQQQRDYVANARGRMPTMRDEFNALENIESPEEQYNAALNFMSKYGGYTDYPELRSEVGSYMMQAKRRADMAETIIKKRQALDNYVQRQKAEADENIREAKEIHKLRNVGSPMQFFGGTYNGKQEDILKMQKTIYGDLNRLNKQLETDRLNPGEAGILLNRIAEYERLTGETFNGGRMNAVIEQLRELVPLAPQGIGTDGTTSGRPDKNSWLEQQLKGSAGTSGSW